MTNQTDLISEVRAALQTATPGNWFVMHDCDIESENPPGSCELDSITHVANVYDAQLIGNSKRWLHQLTDLLENAEKQNEELVKALEHTQDLVHLVKETPESDMVNLIARHIIVTLKRIKGENG